MLKQDFLIRPMDDSMDLTKIINRFSFPWSTPEKTRETWEIYASEQKKGIRTVVVIEHKDEILGYGSLLRKSENPLFISSNIPEVNAIWIDEGYRTTIQYEDDGSGSPMADRFATFLGRVYFVAGACHYLFCSRYLWWLLGWGAMARRRCR